MATDSGHPSGGVWISAAVIGLLFLWRLFRLSRAPSQARNLRLDMLWITPVLYLLLAALVIALQPPHGLEWLWLIAAAGLGGALGWWRGKTIEIAVHSGTGTLIARTSSTTVLFLMGLVALRFGLRYLLAGEAGTLHLTVQLITGTFLAFAVAMVVVQRVEMTLRGARLLAASSAGPKAPERAEASVAPVFAEPPPAAAAAVRTGLSTAQLMMLAAAVFAVILIVGLAMPR